MAAGSPATEHSGAYTLLLQNELLPLLSNTSVGFLKQPLSLIKNLLGNHQTLAALSNEEWLDLKERLTPYLSQLHQALKKRVQQLSLKDLSVEIQSRFIENNTRILSLLSEEMKAELMRPFDSSAEEVSLSGADATTVTEGAPVLSGVEGAVTGVPETKQRLQFVTEPAEERYLVFTQAEIKANDQFFSDLEDPEQQDKFSLIMGLINNGNVSDELKALILKDIPNEPIENLLKIAYAFDTYLPAKWNELIESLTETDPPKKAALIEERAFRGRFASATAFQALPEHEKAESIEQLAENDDLPVAAKQQYLGVVSNETLAALSVEDLMKVAYIFDAYCPEKWTTLIASLPTEKKTILELEKNYRALMDRALLQLLYLHRSPLSTDKDQQNTEIETRKLALCHYVFSLKEHTEFLTKMGVAVAAAELLPRTIKSLARHVRPEDSSLLKSFEENLTRTLHAFNPSVQGNGLIAGPLMTISASASYLHAHPNLSFGQSPIIPSESADSSISIKKQIAPLFIKATPNLWGEIITFSPDPEKISLQDTALTQWKQNFDECQELQDKKNYLTDSIGLLNILRLDQKLTLAPHIIAVNPMVWKQVIASSPEGERVTLKENFENFENFITSPDSDLDAATRYGLILASSQSSSRDPHEQRMKFFELFEKAFNNLGQDKAQQLEFAKTYLFEAARTDSPTSKLMKVKWSNAPAMAGHLRKETARTHQKLIDLIWPFLEQALKPIRATHQDKVDQYLPEVAKSYEPGRMLNALDAKVQVKQQEAQRAQTEAHLVAVFKKTVGSPKAEAAVADAYIESPAQEAILAFYNAVQTHVTPPISKPIPVPLIHQAGIKAGLVSQDVLDKMKALRDGREKDLTDAESAASKKFADYCKLLTESNQGIFNTIQEFFKQILEAKSLLYPSCYDTVFQAAQILLNLPQEAPYAQKAQALATAQTAMSLADLGVKLQNITRDKLRLAATDSAGRKALAQWNKTQQTLRETSSSFEQWLQAHPLRSDAVPIVRAEVGGAVESKESVIANILDSQNPYFKNSVRDGEITFPGEDSFAKDVARGMYFVGEIQLTIPTDAPEDALGRAAAVRNAAKVLLWGESPPENADEILGCLPQNIFNFVAAVFNNALNYNSETQQTLASTDPHFRTCQLNKLDRNTKIKIINHEPLRMEVSCSLNGLKLLPNDSNPAPEDKKCRAKITYQVEYDAASRRYKLLPQFTVTGPDRDLVKRILKPDIRAQENLDTNAARLDMNEWLSENRMEMIRFVENENISEDLKKQTLRQLLSVLKNVAEKKVAKEIARLPLEAQFQLPPDYIKNNMENWRELLKEEPSQEQRKILSRLFVFSIYKNSENASDFLNKLVEQSGEIAGFFDSTQKERRVIFKSLFTEAIDQLSQSKVPEQQRMAAALSKEYASAMLTPDSATFKLMTTNVATAPGQFSRYQITPEGKDPVPVARTHDVLMHKIVDTVPEDKVVQKAADTDKWWNTPVAKSIATGLTVAGAVIGGVVLSGLSLGIVPAAAAVAAAVGFIGALWANRRTTSHTPAKAAPLGPEISAGDAASLSAGTFGSLPSVDGPGTDAPSATSSVHGSGGGGAPKGAHVQGFGAPQLVNPNPSAKAAAAVAAVEAVEAGVV